MSTAVTIAGNNQTAQFVANDPNALPKVWKKKVEMAEQTEDFFKQFEGRTAESSIQLNNDTTADAGMEVKFRTMAGLYGDGVLGDELLFGKGETLRNGGYGLKVDYIRHAVEYRLRTLDQLALAREIEEMVPEQLGAWLGRKKTAQMGMMFRERGATLNTSFPIGRANRDAIRSADTLTMSLIRREAQKLRTGGASPATLKKEGPNKFQAYRVCAIGESLVPLKDSADYKTAQQYAETRGDSNTTFSGGYKTIDGNTIIEYPSIDHDGIGAIASPFNPKAVLGISVTAGTVTFDITGGGNATNGALTDVMYFEFFSEYAYRFTMDDVLTPAGSTRYVIIYNITGANAGKYNFYSYVTNNGNKLTVAGILLPSTGTNAGIANKTLGGVTSATTPGWVDANLSSVHPSGSLVIETNNVGVPIGRTLVMGANAAKRGYGRYTRERTMDSLDGGFLKKSFIMSVFGQSPVQRADGRIPGFSIIEHAQAYAGLTLPVVT